MRFALVTALFFACLCGPGCTHPLRKWGRRAERTEGYCDRALKRSVLAYGPRVIQVYTSFLNSLPDHPACRKMGARLEWKREQANWMTEKAVYKGDPQGKSWRTWAGKAGVRALGASPYSRSAYRPKIGKPSGPKTWISLETGFGFMTGTIDYEDRRELYGEELRLEEGKSSRGSARINLRRMVHDEGLSLGLDLESSFHEQAGPVDNSFSYASRNYGAGTHLWSRTSFFKSSLYFMPSFRWWEKDPIQGIIGLRYTHLETRLRGSQEGDDTSTFPLLGFLVGLHASVSLGDGSAIEVSPRFSFCLDNLDLEFGLRVRIKVWKNLELIFGGRFYYLYYYTRPHEGTIRHRIASLQMLDTYSGLGVSF
ncbi:MAG: hypothetical protein ACYTFG_16105 [Planctomycetota bacterium]|jgi:hypothetical protein